MPFAKPVQIIPTQQSSDTKKQKLEPIKLCHVDKAMASMSGETDNLRKNCSPMRVDGAVESSTRTAFGAGTKHEEQV